MSEATRAWIYRIFLALAAVAVGYGLIDSQEAVLWGGLVIALLGNGLATLNTSTKGA